MRLRPGEAVTVTDGRGRWRLAHLGAELDRLGPVHVEPAPAFPTTIACAWTKGDKPDTTVQKLTELDVHRIVWFTADRSIGRRDTNPTGSLAERLMRVMRSAVCQCRRAWVPELVLDGRFDQLAASPNACRADLGGRCVDEGDTLILIGPEGGWTERECLGVVDKVSVGSHVLRAETAAYAAAALISNARRGCP